VDDVQQRTQRAAQQGEIRPQGDVDKQRQQQQENAAPAGGKEGDKPAAPKGPQGPHNAG